MMSTYREQRGPEETINIFLATDQRALWGCAVTIRSIVDNASAGNRLRFLVASSGLSDTDEERLRSSADRSDVHARVDVFRFDAAPVRKFLKSKNIPHLAYAWLFVARHFMDEVERCICLDIDIVFELDIAELARIDLKGRTIGAVSDGDENHARKQMARLGISSSRYLNSGVLVIDLSRWRRNGYERRAIEFGEGRGNVLFGTHDQDTINAILDDDWVELPPKWNSWASMKIDSGEKKVLHFTQVPKPWHADYVGPFEELFFRYLDRTSWAGSRPWNPMGIGAAVQRCRRRLPYVPKLLRFVKTR